MESILTEIRDYVAYLAQANGAGQGAAFVLIVLVALIGPPPRKRKIRASVYLFAVHLTFLVLAHLFVPGSPAYLFLDLVALFFLLSSLGRSLFVLLSQGVLRRPAERLPRIFLDLLHGTIYLAAFGWCLHAAGADPASLVTGSAVLTAILGLSLRDTLGNLFAGLALEAQRPFDVGDWIQWDSNQAHIGQVAEINWRATKVVTLDAVEITIPHGTLGQGHIINFSKPRRWSRRSIYFNAPYSVPTHLVQQLVLNAITEAFGVMREPAPSVVTCDFDDRGVHYWLRFFTADFDKRDLVDGGVRDRIWYALRRAGIPMPAVQREVTQHQLQHTPETLAKEEQDRLGEKIRALHCVDFFASLQDRELQKLAELSRSHLYGPGEAVICQGEAGEELFIIKQGEVVVSLENPGKPAVEVARMGRGEFFGEMSLLTGEPRSATVRTVKPSELLIVGKAAFGSVLEEFPELVEHVSRIVARRQAVLKSKSSQAVSEDHHDEEEWSVRLLKRIKDFFSI
jgi:small-conductance mechanosensitive channel/CRP-like cAMP-binding protein